MPATTKKSKSNKYGAGWKEKFHDLDLPSGNVCQVRRPGMQGLIKAGILESMDVLTGLVQQVTLQKAEGKPEVSQEKMIENPESITQMLDILDDIVLYVVNRPKVIDKYETYPAEHPMAGQRVKTESGKFVLVPVSMRHEDESDEDSEEDPVIYVDDVDLEDKMFLMNYVVGGSRDLATFREATSQTLGGLHVGQESESPTQ